MTNPDEPQTTPPHHPTYNVCLSPLKIESIVALVLPSHEYVSSEELTIGKSYNNRIYFVTVAPRSPNNTSTPPMNQRDFVLKVSGHFFGPTKVQNEIGSLQLLKRFCPSIPVPQVIAWSEDGKSVNTIKGETFDTSSPTSNAHSERGWILLTRLPGRVCTETDLNGPHGTSLIKEAARHMATWRTQIPAVSKIGNTRFKTTSDPYDPDDSVFSLLAQSSDNANKTPPFTTGGLILENRYDPTPLPTSLSYYTYLIEDALSDLHKSKVLAPLRARIEPQVSRLIKNLPRLRFFHDTSQLKDIKFTHFDFAPRNILISHTGTGEPHITGMLDFEFSAFLPFEDEFINAQVRQEGDWTPEQWEIVIQELARLGCDVPHLPGKYGAPVCMKETLGRCSCDSGAFEGLSVLARVSGSIAPWYIFEGSHGEEELQREFDTATETVIDGIEVLNRFME